MADSPTPVAATPPAAPTAPPAAPPAAPVNTGGNVPQFTESTGVLLTDADGTTREITLGEMAEAWRQRGQVPSGEAAKQFNLFQRVVNNGDQAALKELVSQFYPDTPATPANVQPDTLVALQQQVAQLQQYIQTNVNPVVGSISQLAGRQNLKQELNNVIDRYPALKQVGDHAALEVERQITDIYSQAQAQGVNFAQASPDMRRRVWETALARANDYVAKLTNWQPPATPATPAGSQVVDDQRGTPSKIPAMLRINPQNGVIEMHDAEAVNVTRPGGYAGTIPATPVQPAPVGGAPGVNTGKPTGRTGVQGFLGRLKQQMGGM